VTLAADSVFILMLAVVTVTDLRHRLIPNRVLSTAVVLGLPLLALADLGSLPGRIAAGLAAGGTFLAVALVRPGGFGLGDVKLIAAMGLFLDGAVLAAALVALLAGSLFGLALCVRHGSTAAEQTIAFAPFLALGGLVALLS
jgi:prepilin signal peptidase PulO-like enzyme (type II secretory pathway)